jgi:hypothetical protein
MCLFYQDKHHFVLDISSFIGDDSFNLTELNLYWVNNQLLLQLNRAR